MALPWMQDNNGRKQQNRYSRQPSKATWEMAPGTFITNGNHSNPFQFSVLSDMAKIPARRQTMTEIDGDWQVMI